MPDIPGMVISKSSKSAAIVLRTVHDRLSVSEGLQHFKLGFHQPGDECRKFGMIVGQQDSRSIQRRLLPRHKVVANAQFRNRRDCGSDLRNWHITT